MNLLMEHDLNNYEILSLNLTLFIWIISMRQLIFFILKLNLLLLTVINDLYYKYRNINILI